MAKEFKYKTTFTAKIRSLVDEEKDKYLATASLDTLKQYIPEIDLSKNIDLLPISVNAFVANRINKNGDGVDGETTLNFYKSFINKPLNIEHNRKQTVGVILTANLAKFGTDELLTEEQVKELGSDPFSIIVGGIVWKTVAPNLVKFIEDSNDPDSEYYQKSAGSFEVGFDEYYLALLEGNEKNIKFAEIINDEKLITQFEEEAKASGKNRTKHDKYVGRLIKGDALGLGLGITLAPASEQFGIATKDKKTDLETKADEIIDKLKQVDENFRKSSEELVKALNEISAKKDDKISQSQKTNVNNNRENTKIMKLNSLKELTDDNLKEVTASNINDLVKQALKDASVEYEAKISEKENKAAELENKYKELEANYLKLMEKWENDSEVLKQLQAKEEKREKEAKFQARMSDLDASFDLDEEKRKVLAAEVESIKSDADYENYKKRLTVFVKAKSQDTDKDKQTIVDDAVTSANKDKTTIANTTQVGDSDDLLNKFKKAFGKESAQVKIY